MEPNSMANVDASLSQFQAKVNAAKTFQSQGVTSAELASYMEKVVSPAAVALLEAAVGDRHNLEDNDQLVIHYTSMANLFQMLQQGYLRLYDTGNTNDPQEGDYFNKHASIPSYIEWTRSSPTGPAYVASFIVSDPTKRRCDDLVYWRTYGDSARGCSIEFFASGRDIKKVRYGEHEISKTISTLDPLLQQIRPLTQLPAPIGESVRRFLTEAIDNTLRYLYKSEDFKYEQECRLVVLQEQLDSSLIKFDTRREHNGIAAVRHYYRDSRLTLKSMLGRSGATITLGPAALNQPNIINALKIAFRQLEVYGTVAKCSEIFFQAS